MLRLFDRLTKAAESRGWSVALALSAAAWVAALRMLGERYLAREWVGNRQTWLWFLQIFAFYLSLLTTLGAVLARSVPVPWRRAQNLVGMGLLLGTMPPVIDTIVLGRRAFAYEYGSSANGLPWLLSGSAFDLPVGETTVLWTSVLFMGLYTLRRSGSVVRAVTAFALSYALVLVFLVGHSRIASDLGVRFQLAPTDWRMVVLLATAQLAFTIAIGAERRLIARAPQIALPVVFVVLGAALRGAMDGPALLVASYFALAGIGFALSNDHYDRAEDEAQGRQTSIDGDAAKLLSVIPLVGAAVLVTQRFETGLALIGFSVVAHAYHADPLRLKCVFPLSYKTEGLLAGLCMLAGLASLSGRAPSSAELIIVALVAVGTPAALVFKDFKDVDADAKANVQTAFVFAERHGWPRRRVLIISAGLLLVSLIVPCGWLATRADSFGNVALCGVLALAAPATLLTVKPPKLAVMLAMLLAEACLAAIATGLLPSGAH